MSAKNIEFYEVLVKNIRCIHQCKFSQPLLFWPRGEMTKPKSMYWPALPHWKPKLWQRQKEKVKNKKRQTKNPKTKKERKNKKIQITCIYQCGFAQPWLPDDHQAELKTLLYCLSVHLQRFENSFNANNLLGLEGFDKRWQIVENKFTWSATLWKEFNSFNTKNTFENRWKNYLIWEKSKANQICGSRNWRWETALPRAVYFYLIFLLIFLNGLLFLFFFLQNYFQSAD